MLCVISLQVLYAAHACCWLMMMMMMDNHADADADDEYLPILLVLSKACYWVLYYVL